MKTESCCCRRCQPLACAARAPPAGGPAAPPTARERLAGVRGCHGPWLPALVPSAGSAAAPPAARTGKRPAPRSRGCTPPVALASVSARLCPGRRAQRSAETERTATRVPGPSPQHPPAALRSPPCWVATHLRAPRLLMLPSRCRSPGVFTEAVTGGKKPPLF